MKATFLVGPRTLELRDVPDPAAPPDGLVLAVKAARGIRGGIADRETMTRSIEATLAIQAIGSIWLAGCALYGVWF